MINLKGALKAKEPKSIEVETTKGGLVHWETSQPNQEHPVDASGWKRFDFVDKKGRKYRSYASDAQHAILDICTSHRVFEKDIQLISK